MYREHSRLDADEPMDDVDRLFARLDRPAAPPDLTARVLARTVHAAPAPVQDTRLWPWVLAAFAAIALLAFSGYEIGVLMASSDGLDVLTAVTGDLSIWSLAPGDALAAVVEVIPWPLVGLAGACAAALVWLSGEIASRLSRGLSDGSRRLELSA